ncbi:MAG: 3-beta hydroxysteroid dehydrogenase, partial [Bacteroidetes bacterium CG18_big_fil_WC_8_21_14_2_50_41_14]
TILQKGYRNLSSTKAIETLGFTPRPLSETLTDTLAWFKQNGQLS